MSPKFSSVLIGKTRRQLAQRPTTEEEPGRERRGQDVRITGLGASQTFQSGLGCVPQVGEGQVAEETPWLRDDSLMTSNVMEFTTRDDEIEDQGSQPSGKRKRPMAGGVVFNDGQRVRDVRLEEPPPSRSPQRERFIKSLLTFKGVETQPAWTEALSIFFDIKTNVTKKVVERMLCDAGHFLEAEEVATIYSSQIFVQQPNEMI